MNSFATANTLAAYIRRTTSDAYFPLASSIHTVLKRHGLIALTKYYNGKPVEVYNMQNAKRCIVQYLYEIKQEDQKTKQAKELVKYNSIQPENIQKKSDIQFVPPKHGESRISREQLKLDESLGVSDKITEISNMIFEYICNHHREERWESLKDNPKFNEILKDKDDIYMKQLSAIYDIEDNKVKQHARVIGNIPIFIHLFYYDPKDNFKEKYDYIAENTKPLFKNAFYPGGRSITFSFLWPITDKFTDDLKADIIGTINHEVKHMYQFLKASKLGVSSQYSKALDNMDVENSADGAQWLITYYIPRVYYRFDKDEVAAWLQEIYAESLYTDNIKDTETAKKINETIGYFNFLYKIYKSKKGDYNYQYRDYLIEQIKKLVDCEPDVYFKICKKGLDHFTKHARRVYQRWSNETGKSATGNQGSFKNYKDKEIEQGEIFTGKNTLKGKLNKIPFINNIMRKLRTFYFDL